MLLFGLTKDRGPFIYPRVSQIQIHGHLPSVYTEMRYFVRDQGMRKNKPQAYKLISRELIFEHNAACPVVAITKTKD